MLSKPWIKVATGVLINLNYVIKIVRVDTVAPVYGICFFHASAGTSGGSASGTQKATYVDAATADAKFAEIQAMIEANAQFKDLS